MAEEDPKSTGNELVVYVPPALDLAQNIRELQVPLRKLNPEARIVSNGGMYAAGFCELQFDGFGINGQAYVSFLQALKKENPAEVSLLERMAKKLFGELNKLNMAEHFIVEHEGKEYIKKWTVATTHERLFWFNKYEKRFNPQGFRAEIKTRIANQRHTLLSNELMDALFEPLFDPTIQIYLEVARY